MQKEFLKLDYKKLKAGILGPERSILKSNQFLMA